MRVLHITNNYPTEKHPIFGIFVKEQIESLKKAGIICDVFFINSREKGKVTYLSDSLKLFIYLIKNRYDVIHCHHAFSGFIFILTGHAFFVKSILSYQNAPENEGGTRLFKFLYPFFNKIIFKYKDDAIKLPKIVYLPNGVNIEMFNAMEKSECRKKLGLEMNKKYILFTDSYKKRKQKRIDRFDAMIHYLINDLKVKDIVPLVLTNTSREIMPLYINASDVHVITSDFEGSPNSVKECLACNIPVVSTRVGNIDDLLGDIDGCFICKSFEPSELALLVKKSLENDNFYGRQFIEKKNLTIDAVAKTLIDLYSKTLNNYA